MRKHPGLWRAFDLSAWGYFLDFALVPVAVVLLVEDGISVAELVGGFVAWSFTEYWIHRLVFHGATPFEPMHQMHHALPKEMIGVASWGTFAGFAVIWFIFGSAFCGGFMLGYLSYCAIHVRMHHGNRAQFSRYVSFMFDHHAGHHRGGSGNFGVSSPVWDFAFGTYQPKRK
jgi:sterol desaturase/sphingolipid hydroxylase (fatty acid hydroxylase superfamily)